MYSEIYSFVAQNRVLFRFLYSVIIAFICLIIVLKTDRLFRISSHQGIRYFRNAFFFYGLAFIFRYILGNPIYFNPMRVVFEFFMIMGGFCLFYSLLWKRFENSKDVSSLFNSRIIIFYILTIIIVALDYLWKGFTFMFISQIILFFFASIISYQNYKKDGKKYKFLKLYFIVMVLNFIAWILNFAFTAFFDWRLRWVANIYIINVLVFLIFLYGVVKLTKKRR
jgi:hypothetical protein